MRNQKENQEQKKQPNKFRVVSLQTIERAGLNIKVSSNGVDGGVLIFVTSNFFNYANFKSFLDSKSAREWVDNLVNTSASLLRLIQKEK